MPKFVTYRLMEQQTVIEAESAEAAQAIADARDPNKSLWGRSRSEYMPSPNKAHLYQPKEIDWAAVRALPKPIMSTDEVMAITRGDPELRIYLIAYHDQDGQSRDLTVEAPTPGAAFELWGDYYHEDEWINQRQWCLDCEGIDGILVEDSKCNDEDLRIFELAPTTGLPRAFKWNTDDLKVVAWVEQS